MHTVVTRGTESAHGVRAGQGAEVDHVLAGLRLPVPSAHEYWDRVGVAILGPDGFRVVLIAGSWPD
jgi:hypothetical protein